MAVFDTGLEAGGHDFSNVVERINWTDEETLSDTVGHGTHIAGGVTLDLPRSYRYIFTIAVYVNVLEEHVDCRAPRAPAMAGHLVGRPCLRDCFVSMQESSQGGIRGAPVWPRTRYSMSSECSPASRFRTPHGSWMPSTTPCSEESM